MQANVAQPTQSAGLFTRPADADVVLGRIPTHTPAPFITRITHSSSSSSSSSSLPVRVGLAQVRPVNRLHSVSVIYTLEQRRRTCIGLLVAIGLLNTAMHPQPRRAICRVFISACISAEPLVPRPQATGSAAAVHQTSCPSVDTYPYLSTFVTFFRSSARY